MCDNDGDDKNIDVRKIDNNTIKGLMMLLFVAAENERKFFKIIFKNIICFVYGMVSWLKSVFVTKLIFYKHTETVNN